MYKETNNKKASVAVIFVFVAFALIFHIILGILPILTIVKDVAFMALMVAFVFVFVKRYMTTYEYELHDDKIVISAILGNRPRSIAEAELDSIRCFCPITDENHKNYKGYTQVMCSSKEGRYALVVDGGSDIVKIIFAPSEKLVSLITEKIQK